MARGKKKTDNEDIDKKIKKTKLVKHDSQKEEDEEDDECVLSELDVEDEAVESEDNDVVVSSNTSKQTINHNKKKEINPNTPIGQLSPIDILHYLITLASDPNNPNPTLKFNTIQTLREMKGNRRPRRKRNYGSKSNNNYGSKSNGNGYGSKNLFYNGHNNDSMIPGQQRGNVRVMTRPNYKNSRSKDIYVDE